MRRPGRRHPSRRPPRPDRRLASRYEIRDAEVAGPVLSGRILNLSRSGLAIETGRALRVGAPYRFTVTGGERSVEFEGRILWCRLRTTRAAGGEVEPVYRAGIGLERRGDLESLLDAPPGTAMGGEIQFGPSAPTEPDRPAADPSAEAERAT